MKVVKDERRKGSEQGRGHLHHKSYVNYVQQLSGNGCLAS